MGYLNNQVVTVDAILTTKGRELLAKNDGTFRITQFALADDEIDYTLYNPTHPSGSAFYGEAIQNMPLLEAFPIETQIMKYKLATLPRGTAKLPVLDLGYSAITLKQGASLAITPQTPKCLSQYTSVALTSCEACIISNLFLPEAAVNTKNAFVCILLIVSPFLSYNNGVKAERNRTIKIIEKIAPKETADLIVESILK